MPDLLKGTHERSALQSLLTRHAREIEELRRAGFVGTDPVTEAVEVEADLGSIFTAGNQVIVSKGIGSAATLDVPQHSVIVRKTGAIETATASSTGQVLYRDSAGTLGFSDAHDFAMDSHIVSNLGIETATADASGGGAVTVNMDETVGMYVPVFSGSAADLSLKLPAPSYNGKWYIVADCLGYLDATHRLKIIRNSGADDINSLFEFPNGSWITGAHSVVLLTYALGTPGGPSWAAVLL